MLERYLAACGALRAVCDDRIHNQSPPRVRAGGELHRALSLSTVSKRCRDGSFDGRCYRWRTYGEPASSVCVESADRRARSAARVGRCRVRVSAGTRGERRWRRR